MFHPTLKTTLTAAALLLLAPFARAATTAPTTGTVSGRCLTQSGQPVTGVTVYVDVLANNVKDSTEPFAVSAADGSYTIANVPAGSWKIRQVPASFYNQGPKSGGWGPVNVVAGQTAQCPITDVLLGLTAKPVAVVVTTPTTQSAYAVPTGEPIYYVANEGNDQADGKTAATAWLTPREMANAAVVLAPGETFNISSSINMMPNGWLGGDPEKPLPTLCETSHDGTLTNWAPNPAGPEKPSLCNLIATSIDGSGSIGNVRGHNVSILNVQMLKLVEGFDYAGCSGTLTIMGGSSTGVAGRAHYFLGVGAINWTGGTFGAASTQEPTRFSAPGPAGGTITGVTMNQIGTPYKVAAYAIHGCANVVFQGCQVLADDQHEQFSLDTAGSEVGAGQVHNNIFKDTLISGAQLYLNAGVAANNTFLNTTITCPGASCVVLGRTAGGNVIDGGAFTTNAPNSHDVIHFNSASDTVIRNVHALTTNPQVHFFGGAWTPANDGGGNTLNGVAVRLAATTQPSVAGPATRP